MLQELDENELLVRYFKRPEEERDFEHILWPTDFERRRKPVESLDENGISLSRLVTNSDGSRELPPKLKKILSKRSGYIGFATTTVRDLRRLGYKLVVDNEFHVSLLCEFCNEAVLTVPLCEPADSQTCSLQPEIDFSLRQLLADRFRIEPTITL
jgi:hypothetical protein